jgi:hypothetical protein
MHRRRDPDDPGIAEAHRDLEVAKLVEHARKVAAGLPPPTEAQIEKVAAMLRAGRKGTG